MSKFHIFPLSVVSVANCLLCLIKLVIFFFLSKFPPSVYAPSVPSALSEELRVAVVVPMDAMLTQLLSFRPFAESVLDPDHGKLLLANYYNRF